jgi:hypothetical protein
MNGLTVSQFNARLKKIESLICKFEDDLDKTRFMEDVEGEKQANTLLNRARGVWAKFYAAGGEGNEPFEFRMRRTV